MKAVVSWRVVVGGMDKRDFLVMLALAGVFIFVYNSDFGVIVKTICLVVPAFSYFGWRWIHARQARNAARQEAPYLQQAFLERISGLSQADKERLIRNLTKHD